MDAETKVKVLNEQRAWIKRKEENVKGAGVAAFGGSLQPQLKNPVYQSDKFQIQEVGIFLLGYSAHHNSSALAFLKDTVSRHDSWKVQKILAMSFDNHCKIIGYDEAVPLIEEWLNSNRANVRRAVSEGLRIWTNRPYFRDNPQIAIQLLSAHREDTSEYVRKSVGNALRGNSSDTLLKNMPKISACSMIAKCG